MSRQFPDDPYNPYASPAADLRRPVETLAVPPLSFDIGEIISRSWEVYKARMGLTIGVVLGCGILNFGVGFVQGMVNDMITRSMAGQAGVAIMLTLALTFASLLFQTWINIGVSLTLLKIARGEPAAFGDVFTGARYLGTTILAAIVVGLAFGGLFLVAMLPGIVAGAAMGGDPTTTMIISVVSIAIAVGLMILLGIRISQFLYVIIDQNAGAMESLRISTQLTSRRVLTLIVIFILTFLINMGGALMLLVGLIFTAPLTQLILVMTYCAMVDKPGRVNNLAAPKPGTYDGLL